MDTPDKRALLSDLEDAPFQIGVANGYWGLAEIAWPFAVFWVAAALRPNSPDRFFVRLDFQGYPTQAPTGNFCDPTTKEALPSGRRPKGRERVEKVFRTDWEGGRAFYHPYDRGAAASHPNWAQESPRRAWTRDRSIVDLLGVLHDLLNSSEYTGV
jgi:hypothetical protein